jgi:hypothetical protein
MLLIGTLFISGCNDTKKDGGSKEIIVYIEKNNDDAFIAANEIFLGIVKAESDSDMIVGLFRTTDYSHIEEFLISRCLLRFNLSEWNDYNVTFNIKCTAVQGNPGLLEVYIVDDPAIIEDRSEFEDVFMLWNLHESSGYKIGEISPVLDKWSNVSITKDVLKTIIEEKYPKGEYLTIFMKLAEENLITYDDYYGFASVDYTPDYKKDQPYLIFHIE